MASKRTGSIRARTRDQRREFFQIDDENSSSDALGSTRGLTDSLAHEVFEMNYHSAIGELVSEFPNLKDLVGYDEAIGLQHPMFGSVFCPWVRRLLKSSARSALDDVELGKAFRFIERMLEAGDEDLENVVLVTILNYLVHYCGRDVVAPWCGPLSASWLDRLPPP